MKIGCGVSSAPSAELAAREAAESARRDVADAKLALVFVSAAYDDAEIGARAARAALDSDLPIIGGTAGGAVHANAVVAKRGASVLLVGGDDVEVAYAIAPAKTPSLIEAVPAAEEIARAADAASRRGFAHYACLVFGPGVFVDGEALVAAARKGAGARAQLAGGLTGDDLTLDRPRIFAGDELRNDRVAFAGLFSKKPLGVAAKHGFKPVGPERIVTRADGVLLLELDGRPALDVWIEDARAAGATIPDDPAAIALYLASHYELGFVPGGDDVPGSERAAGARELVARAPLAVRPDGAIQMSASVAERTACQVVSATNADMMAAAERAAIMAAKRAGGEIAGAFLFPCSGRLVALGADLQREHGRVQATLGGVPTAGACVFGEIVRAARESDAFFNTTLGVVAFPR